MTNELVATVAQHSAEIVEIRRSLNHLGNEVHCQSSKMDQVLQAMGELKAHKPIGVMEIFKGIGVIGTAFAILTAFIVYLATGAFETRIALLEYKQEQLLKKQARQRTSFMNKTDMLGYFPDHAAE